MSNTNGQFQKGRAKTGGRQKGTPNKRTTDIMEVLNDINPIGRLETILNNTDDENLKARICLDLLPYMIAKKKSVDINNVGAQLPQIVVRFGDKEKDISEFSI